MKISKTQLKEHIRKLVREHLDEQVHGGDFAAWGDEEDEEVAPEETPSRPTEPSSSKNMPKVGDIFVSNWGYEQTNIDFYKVVAASKSGGPGVKIVKLGKTYLKSKESYQVPVIPNEHDVKSAPVSKRISKQGSIKISSYSYAYPWDGKPEMETASGYGH